MRRAPALALLFSAALPLHGPPSPPAPPARKTPSATSAARPPLDFSGTWQLDPRTSLNVSSQMERAVLEVSQKGDRIWITPARKKMSVLAEEIVADGRPYEKALGNEKGVVTAAWAQDGKSLRLEITAGVPPNVAVQSSRWKLLSDGAIWVRETRTVENGRARQSRLVFRRVASGNAATPPAPAAAGPKR